jgi:exosortase B
MIQPQLSRRLALPWLVALAGFASMYVPTYWWAATTIWQTEEQAHGALIMLVVAWLFWERKDAIAGVRPAPSPVAGWLCFAFGLATFFLGRLLSISILELGSQIPVLAGAILVLAGRPGIRAVWFPLLYLAFAVPLPGILVDAVTSPLKQWISHIAEEVLYAGGYPIARQGVVLVIGQYQLLVADACSGLHSMFSLSALGVLFLHLKQRTGWLHNGILIACILPIAFLANIVRVIVLILVTYHLGDEAGQGFLHGGAGMVLMVVALLVFFVSDAFLAKVLNGQRAS